MTVAIESESPESPDSSMQPRVRTLLAGARSGDERAWDELLDRFGSMIWAIARAHRLCDADAADVMQATWTALLTHLDQLKDPDRVGAWLATTARRECLRLLGQARSIVPYGDDLPELEAGEQDPIEGLAVAHRDAALWRSFRRLRDSDQALLRLLIADPAPCYEEISAALEIPVGSIGPTRARALERLRRELRRDGALAVLRA
jgi:RNA polymerase sigma factor (sigma-70 family)